jgi:hypothetical protein
MNPWTAISAVLAFLRAVDRALAGEPQTFRFKARGFTFQVTIAVNVIAGIPTPAVRVQTMGRGGMVTPRDERA